MSVYFIRYGESELVKIGTSTKAPDRIRDLQCGSPEKITTLAIIEGDRDTEKALHARFAHLKVRARGEWFRPDAEMLAFLQSPQAIVETERAIARRTKSISARNHLLGSEPSSSQGSDQSKC